MSEKGLKWYYRYGGGLLILLMAVATCLISYKLGFYDHRTGGSDTISIQKDSVRDTVFIEVHDTVPYKVKENVVNYVKIPIKSSSSLDKDSIMSSDSAIVMPVVQRVYKRDSLYEAWVSGIKYGDWPRLDSINTYTRTVTHTVTKTITVREQESPFGIGLQAGYGYGFQYKGFEPYVGIGLTYRFNLFKRKKKPK